MWYTFFYAKAYQGHFEKQQLNHAIMTLDIEYCGADGTSSPLLISKTNHTMRETYKQRSQKMYAQHNISGAFPKPGI